MKFSERIRYEELEWDLTGRLCMEVPPEEAKRILEESGSEQRGLLVWNDPWDVNGWKLTDGFVKRWGFLVEGCHEIYRSTNQWRDY